MTISNKKRQNISKEYVKFLYRLYDHGIVRGIIRCFGLLLAQHATIIEYKSALEIQDLVIGMERKNSDGLLREQLSLMQTCNGLKGMLRRQYERVKASEAREERLYKFIHEHIDCGKCGMQFLFENGCGGDFEDCKSRIEFAIRREDFKNDRKRSNI